MRLIDADAILKHQRLVNGCYFGPEDAYVTEAVYVEEIRRSPTIDPVKHAFWKDEIGIRPITKKKAKTGRLVCSACNFGTPISFNYCPGCGAKMDLENAEA